MYLKLKIFGSSTTKQPKASGAQPPDPLLQISTIKLSPLPRMSHIHSLTSTNIIVTKLARPDTGITDKTEIYVEPH